MSRYVNVTLPLRSLDELAAALTHMALPFERSSNRTMLEGSLECPGEPVDIRLPAGTLGTVEDFGFTLTDTTLSLVCGELDEDLLQEKLVQSLHTTIVGARLTAAGMTTRTVDAGDGVTRIVIEDD